MFSCSKGSHDSRLALEPRERPGLVDQAVAHHLQGDPLAGCKLRRFVDDGHAAPPDAAQDPIPVQHLAAQPVVERAAETVGDDVGQHDRQLGILRREAVEIRSRQRQEPDLRRGDDVRRRGLLRDQRHLARHRAARQRADRTNRPVVVPQEHAGLAVDHDEQRVALLPLADDRLVRVVAALPRGREDLIHEPWAQRAERLAFDENLAGPRVGRIVGRHRVWSICPAALSFARMDDETT